MKYHPETPDNAERRRSLSGEVHLYLKKPTRMVLEGGEIG